jgi:hypothetical protein
MEANTLELIKQMKDESHPQHRLQFVGLEVGQLPGSYPGLDLKRESQTITVKVTKIRQGAVLICAGWWVNWKTVKNATDQVADFRMAFIQLLDGWLVRI